MTPKPPKRRRRFSDSTHEATDAKMHEAGHEAVGDSGKAKPDRKRNRKELPPIKPGDKWAGLETEKQWKEYADTLLGTAKRYAKEAKKVIMKYMDPRKDEDKTERYFNTRQFLIGEHTRIIYSYHRDLIKDSEKSGAERGAALRQRLEERMQLYMKTLELVLVRKEVTRKRLAELKHEMVGISRMLTEDVMLSQIYMEKILTGAPLNNMEIRYIVSKVEPANLSRNYSGDKEITRELDIKGHMHALLGPVFRHIVGNQMKEFAAVFVNEKGAEEFIKLADALVASTALQPNAYYELLKYSLVNSDIKKPERKKLEEKYNTFNMPEYEKQYAEAEKVLLKWAENMKYPTFKNNLERALSGKNLLKAFAMTWGTLTFTFNAFAHRKKLDTLIENPYAMGALGAVLWGTGTLDRMVKARSKKEKTTLGQKEAREYLGNQHETRRGFANFLFHGGYGAIVEFQKFHKEKRLREGGLTRAQQEQMKTKTRDNLFTGMKDERLSAGAMEEFLETRKDENAAGLRALFKDMLSNYDRVTINVMLEQTHKHGKILYLNDQKEYAQFISEHNATKGNANDGISQQIPRTAPKMPPKPQKPLRKGRRRRRRDV